MNEIPVEKIILQYKCPECGDTHQQPLSEIVEVGTAVCTGCDCDMELLDTVLVKD